MPGLRTPPGELSDDELVVVVRTISALLIGAAYRLYDQAIAEAMEKNITAPGKRNFEDASFRATGLHGKKEEPPRLHPPVDAAWVEWATSTRANWEWLRERYAAFLQSYMYRFHCAPAWYLEVRRTWLTGPRPRAPGLTPFPEEPC